MAESDATQAQVRLQEATKAVKAYESTFNQDRDNPKVRTEMGRLMGEEAQALTAFNRIIEGSTKRPR